MTEIASSKTKDFIDTQAVIYHARLQDAIANSRQTIGDATDGTPVQFTTEVYLLGEVILPFVKRDLERLRGKMILVIIYLFLSEE